MHKNGIMATIELLKKQDANYVKGWNDAIDKCLETLDVWLPGDVDEPNIVSVTVDAKATDADIFYTPEDNANDGERSPEADK